MVTQVITLTAKDGFHARPASMFVKMANGFKSDITLSFGENAVNGKSIMSILTLGASSGSDVTLKAVGEDEAEAFEALIAFLKVME
jgi:phosphocarrier protein HPr